MIGRSLPGITRDLDVLDQAPAGERDLTFELHRQVDHLLHAVDVRGERRDHHSTLGSLKRALQTGSYGALGRSRSGTFDVR